ncbi:hypothetical protein R3W88_013340 [Solanum pinnatisectum]|uniref:Syringolide-induced protein 14-1-1 n=1 Tax=Solanum pinnatisectum TaxID=50273 RepID=A0AAV9LCR7_9SOLN|nr:hypothetical protein R3W88_013340 [Solanum pinnatisectum]
MEKEKPTKPKKNMILKFLPKAAAATIIFQNHPFSPGREKRLHHNHKGYSGPIIPAEARNRKSNQEEPTSPKVSCIGQIKQRKKKECPKSLEKNPSNKKKKSSSSSNFRNIFQRRRKIDVNKNSSDVICEVENRATCLSQMRKYASGREGNLSNFDWKNVQITPDDHRKYYSDDDRDDYRDGDEDEDEDEEEVIIPFSAPILVGRDNRPNFTLEPKKEINLWKRRTMTKPNPLQLKK